MYLSRLTLNTRRPLARRLLSDIHAVHRLVMDAFPRGQGSEARASLGVLFRIDPGRPGRGEVHLLVQSRGEPSWLHLDPALVAREPECKEVGAKLDVIEDGAFLRFSLVANPSKKVSLEGRRNSSRVELFREADQLDWLRRQAERNGFSVPGLAAGFDAGSAPFPQDIDRLGRADIPAVQVQRLDTLMGSRTRGDHRLTVVPVRYDGVLQVTDADAFRAALAAGFGPAKAFGCGLMLVGRAR